MNKLEYEFDVLFGFLPSSHLGCLTLNKKQQIWLGNQVANGSKTKDELVDHYGLCALDVQKYTELAMEDNKLGHWSSGNRTADEIETELVHQELRDRCLTLESVSYEVLMSIINKINTDGIPNRFGLKIDDNNEVQSTEDGESMVLRSETEKSSSDV